MRAVAILEKLPSSCLRSPKSWIRFERPTDQALLAEKEILMETKMCIEDFVRQVLTPAISKLSPEEKREFREAWLAHCDRSSLSLTGDDVRWLRRIRINPSGD